MKYNKTLFNSILNDIEESLSYMNDDISTPHGWNMISPCLKIQDLFDKYPRDDKNEIKYIINVLERMNYIVFSTNDHTFIEGITDKGLRFFFTFT